MAGVAEPLIGATVDDLLGEDSKINDDQAEIREDSSQSIVARDWAFSSLTFSFLASAMSFFLNFTSQSPFLMY